MTQAFMIPGNPVTKKNGSRIFRNRKTGKPFIVPSEQNEVYTANAGRYLKPLRINYPVNVKAIYYMANLRRVDKTNLESGLLDILVNYGVLVDDSALSPAIVVSTDGSRVLLDRENPRVEITIEEVDA